jgi:hypothetical protein
MSLLRLWLIATVALVIGALTWGFFPILVPVVLVLGGLGALVVVIVRLARALERRRSGR